MIYREQLFGVLNACTEIDHHLTKAFKTADTKEEREYIRNVRAHMADICELTKEQDY